MVRRSPGLFRFPADRPPRGEVEPMARTHETEHDELEQSRMTFGEHLDELRGRLITALWAFFAAFVICWVWNEALIKLVCAPLFWVLTYNGYPPALFPRRVTEVFFTSMWVAAIAGFVISSPFILYQLWAFVAAGLYRNERRVVYTYAPLSLVCFIIGAVFFYLLVLPIALNYFVGFGKDVRFDPSEGPPPMIRLFFGSEWQHAAGETPPPVPPLAFPLPPGADGRPGATVTVPGDRLLPAVPRVETDPDAANDWTFPPGTAGHEALRMYPGLIWYNTVTRELKIAVDYRARDPNDWWAHVGHNLWGAELAPQTVEWDIRVLPFQPKSFLGQAFTLDDYIGFVSMMTLLFGLAFQVPLVVMFSIKVGFIERAYLASIRRYVFFAVVVIAAIITPTPDPVTLMMLAVPMYLLYELGMLLSRLTGKPVAGVPDEDELEPAAAPGGGGGAAKPTVPPVPDAEAPKAEDKPAPKPPREVEED
jgi:sec-independent protein translocase protein TatC